MSCGYPGALPARVILRWCVVAIVLFAEATLLTHCFDTSRLKLLETNWALVLTATKSTLPCGIAVGAGIALFGRDLISLVVREQGAELPAYWRHVLAVHALSMLGFWTATAFMFNKPPSTDWAAALGLAAWSLCAMGSLGSAMLLLLPPAAWSMLNAQGASKCALGIGVGVTAWLAGQQSDAALWHPLSAFTLDSVRALLQVLVPGEVLVPDGLIAGTQRFSVQIGIGCSGYEGIGLAWIFLSSYLWISRSKLRWPSALWILPLGTLAIWLGNILRIVALIMIGNAGMPELAVGVFHTRMGWVLFCLIALAAVAVVEGTSWFQTGPAPRPRQRTAREPVVAYVAPLLGLLGMQFAGAAVIENSDLVYGLSIALGLGLLLYFRPAYGPIRCAWSMDAICAGMLVFIVWVALERGPSEVMASETGTPWVAGGVALGLIPLWRSLASILIIPVAEELAFRGYLTRRLIKQRFSDIPLGSYTLYSCITSSILFGLAHDRWFVGSLAGLTYALVLYRKRRLSEAILAHAVTNGLLVLWASCS